MNDSQQHKPACPITPDIAYLQRRQQSLERRIALIEAKLGILTTHSTTQAREAD